MQYLKSYAEREITIRVAEILRYLAYNKEKREPSPAFQKIIDRQVALAYSLIKPLAIYSLVDNSSLQDHHILKDAEKIVFGVCTIGSALEEQVDKYFKERNYLEGVVLDAIGTVAVENLVESVGLEIKKKAANQGFCISARLGPGYENWPLDDQHLLFSYLPHEPAGVKINSSGMMLPQKSISFAYTMGREDMDMPNHTTCHLCDLSKRCAYKKNYQQDGR
jgi:hypothetical protein